MVDDKKFPLIQEAETIVDIRKSIPPDTPTVSEAQSKRTGPPGTITGVLLHATEALPNIDVPPHAKRVLIERGTKTPAIFDNVSPSEETAPRIGGYALIARFPSSAAADVFLGYKVAKFGFIRRAVVKWAEPDRSDYAMRRQALLDEARAISFVSHPNIVSILDVGDDDDAGAYIALEYVAGTDLRRVAAAVSERKDQMPVDHACFIVCELLRGLQHVHDAVGPDAEPLGIVHRDVNPSNVLLSDDGHVKLTDFGTVLMRGRMQDATAPGMVKGKVRYLAPEYIADQTCTNRVDIYSVGTMMFELLTGRPCFMASSNTSVMMRIVREGLPYDELRRANVPEGLAAIVERATARLANERYANAIDMCHAIEDWLADAPHFVSASRLSTYMHAHGLYV